MNENLCNHSLCVTESMNYFATKSAHIMHITSVYACGISAELIV